MGSSPKEGEEERLVQMVHDFIESDSASPPISPDTHPPLQFHHPTSHVDLLQGILRGQSDVETEVFESVLKLMKMKSKVDAVEGERTPTTLNNWLTLRLKMVGFNASLRQTSWVTTMGCPAGCYEYIEVMVEDENGGGENSVRRLIVDTDFKSQFEVARPTPTYKQLSDTLPHVFVGEEHKLRKIISLLCSAAKESLEERGLHIPPWRTKAYMQCKWLPTGQNFEGNAKAMFGTTEFEEWGVVVKPKRSLFSDMSINCC